MHGATIKRKLIYVCSHGVFVDALHNSYPLSANLSSFSFLLRYEDNNDTWKLLNFIERYVSKKI
jgi:hypothetical protein